jgi:hypothetical protein
MGRQKSNIKSYIPKQYSGPFKDPLRQMMERQSRPKSDLTLEEYMQTQEYADFKERQSKNQG